MSSHTYPTLSSQDDRKSQVVDTLESSVRSSFGKFKGKQLSSQQTGINQLQYMHPSNNTLCRRLCTEYKLYTTLVCALSESKYFTFLLRDKNNNISAYIYVLLV